MRETTREIEKLHFLQIYFILRGMFVWWLGVAVEDWDKV